MEFVLAASEDKLYFLIQLTAHRLKKRADKSLLKSAGMTTAQSAVMTLIAAKQPVNQRYLADTLAQNESAITAMVNRLIKLGCVTKARCTNDGRAWLLETTVDGRAALVAGADSFKQINELLDRSLQLGETGSFAEILESILNELD